MIITPIRTLMAAVFDMTVLLVLSCLHEPDPASRGVK
jgi:hypothetical protein